MPQRATWRSLFKDAYLGWSSDQVTRLSASLAYYMIFSVAPLVLITVAVAGLFLGDQAAEGVVSEQLMGLLGPDKARALEAMIAGANKPGIGSLAGVVGTITILLGASGVVGELQASLNQIYGIRPIAKSFLTTLRRRFVSIGFVLGMGFMLLISLLLSAAVAAAGKFFAGALHMPEAGLQGLNQAASFAVETALFAMMFQYLPDARVSWKDLSVGAAFTALLFTLGNVVLGLYLGKGGPTSAYGAAGSLLAVLLWTYYCAQIVYFGAEFTSAYAKGRGHGIRRVDRT